MYWRTGLCYYDRESRGAVQIRAIWDEGQSITQRGRIEVWAEGNHASRLARHLVQSIESIRIGSITEIIWQRGQKDADAERDEQMEAVKAPFSGIAPETEEKRRKKGAGGNIF